MPVVEVLSVAEDEYRSDRMTSVVAQWPQDGNVKITIYEKERMTCDPLILVAKDGHEIAFKADLDSLIDYLERAREFVNESELARVLIQGK